ncbi:MAG: DNA-3-methyladenine glycosylase, partial [Selenomonadaceae bacterium]|nr:DNA-3-methyladenine glycosylase [Selenomonadaceae bacterium]
MMKLEREFYLRDGLTVARELIGKKLVTNLPDGLTSGIIVETEAYMGAIDAAAHSYRGLTDRTKIFFGAGGFVYVYLIYGRNLCTNVVANVDNVPEAVLIRALE